jgi:hypothetical protein
MKKPDVPEFTDLLCFGARGERKENEAKEDC